MPGLRQIMQRTAPPVVDENRRKRDELCLASQTALSTYMAELVRQQADLLEQGPTDIGQFFELSTTIAQVGAATRVMRFPARG
jgi:hypothetical protein